MNDFATIEEAQLTATHWLWIYNDERPSIALGGITPAMKLAESIKNSAASHRVLEER